MSDTKLLPCPFCFETPQLHRDTPTSYWMVVCFNCDQSAKTPQDASKLWNTRAPGREDALRDALRAMISRFEEDHNDPKEYPIWQEATAALGDEQ